MSSFDIGLTIILVIINIISLVIRPAGSIGKLIGIAGSLHDLYEKSRKEYDKLKKHHEEHHKDCGQNV